MILAPVTAPFATRSGFSRVVPTGVVAEPARAGIESR